MFRLRGAWERKRFCEAASNQVDLALYEELSNCTAKLSAQKFTEQGKTG
jgi:hypothetical protein